MPKTKYQLSLEKEAEKWDIQVRHCAIGTTLTVLSITISTFIVMFAVGTFDKYGDVFHKYKVVTYAGDTDLYQEAASAGVLRTDPSSDWSMGWQCDGAGAIYTWKNKLQFKKDFPKYVEGSEETIAKELSKANEGNIINKLTYLQDNFYDACQLYSKDIYINTSEWICCKISGDEKPTYTIHKGSKMKFEGQDSNPNFYRKSIVVPPSADISSFTYSTDSHKYGSTKTASWNNGFQCLLDTKDETNEKMKLKQEIAIDTEEMQDVTAEKCSSWCDGQNLKDKSGLEGTNLSMLNQPYTMVYPSCCEWKPASQECYFGKSSWYQNNVRAEWDGTTASIFYPFPSWN